MPLEELNVRKFADCLAKYRNHCGRALWVKNELPKFYFANLLTRRIQLRLQTPEMILEVCERVQDQNFYFQQHPTRIAGIQFLPKTGETQFSEPVTIGDVMIFRNLAGLERWSENDFAGRAMSYSALSGWLGTLLPAHFTPVTSLQFSRSIEYLFDLDPRPFKYDDFSWFVHSQKYFYMTKRALREFDLDALYLKDIAEYVRFKHPKSKAKTRYEEFDVNWLTQDFHLFVYREILGRDVNGQRNVSRRRRDIPPGLAPAEISRIYVP